MSLIKFYDKYVVTIIIIAILLSLIDLILTIYAINTGYFEEANPIPRFLFNKIGYFLTYILVIIYIIIIIPFSFEVGKLIRKIEGRKYTKKIRIYHARTIAITLIIMELIVIIRSIILLKNL